MSNNISRRRGLIPRLVIILVASCIIGIVVLAVMYFHRAATNVWGTDISSPDMHDISRLTSISFPEDSVLLMSKLYRIRSESCLIAKISIKKSDVSRFIAVIPSKEEVSQGDDFRVQGYPFFLDEGFPGLDTGPVRKYKKLLASKRDQTHFWECRILIGLDSPDDATIYIQWILD